MGIAGPAPSGAPICFKNYIIMTVRKLFPVPNPTLEFKIPKLSLVVDIEITCSMFRARASVSNTLQD